MRYRWKAGMWAHVLHRLSGLALSAYLLAHLVVTKQLVKDPQSFHHAMGILENPIFRFLEIGLLGVIIYHALNGLRVIVFDFFDVPSKAQKPLWYGVVAIFLAIFLVGGWLMLQAILHSMNG